MVPFHMLGMVSYYCALATLSVRRNVYEIFDFKNDVTLKTVLGVSQGHWKCRHLTEHMTSYHNDVNCGSISCRFWDIQCRQISWPWYLGQGSLKVIGTDTDWSATYDFLLTFHSNHEPISYRFRDKRDSKIAFFPPRVFNVPRKGLSLELVSDAKGQKPEWWATRWSKKL